jgi:very-short-patch-repair endonuclease
MTDAERKLWHALRARQFAATKFRRQVPIGPYIADFLCYEVRLVIEVDGGQHAESMRDSLRDRWFERNMFRVLRFWNNEVLNNLEGVTAAILSAVAAGNINPLSARGEGEKAPAASEDRS